MSKHVLYFALQPPPEIAAQALDRLTGRGVTARAVAAARLHVSLNFVGEFKRPPGPVIDKACEAVEEVFVRRFAVSFNRLATWRSGEAPWPVVLCGDEGVIGVEGLYGALHRALAKATMVPRREAEITPHMTLAHDRAVVDETFVDPVAWRADDFVLIHAVHGEGRFEVVGRWPLQD